MSDSDLPRSRASRNRLAGIVGASLVGQALVSWAVQSGYAYAIYLQLGPPSEGVASGNRGYWDLFRSGWMLRGIETFLLVGAALAILRRASEREGIGGRALKWWKAGGLTASALLLVEAVSPVTDPNFSGVWGGGVRVLAWLLIALSSSSILELLFMRPRLWASQKDTQTSPSAV